MKRLILLRHAKAVPAGGALPDRNRDLAPRGEGDAAWAGRELAARGWMPDAALVSDAARTRQTAALALAAAGAAVPLRFEPRLYEATPGTILACIAATDPAVGCLLVVGHNPGMAEAAVRLARHGAAATLARLGQGFPTAALALLRVDQPGWADVARADGLLDAFLAPG